MAAKQQGKKKAKAVKGRKPQKKHQLAKRKQMKFQPRKQKKLQSRLKHKAKAVSTEQPKICSPRLFASKILRQMPKVRMEAKARGLMKTLLTDLYDHVATEVQTLTQKSEPSDISCTHVQTALKDAMAKELAKHMAEEAPPTHTNTSPSPSPSPSPNCA
ncbi:histone H2B.v3-like [Hemicordylus capensis]|uniref:histone H2B.v3-like n=1 Tax=Hemicordylus capensis TaxID=884348 RepID=UPI002303BB3E|nr:histone H2B.v3-like [Hemicordylus capensis]